MDCLIFGAYGYLGSRIYDYFNILRNKVVIGTQANFPEIHKNFKIIRNYKRLSDIQLRELIKEFDLVIDATGISGLNILIEDKVEIIKSNTLWPCTLAKACIETKTKLVWFSTYHCENIKIDNEEKIKKGIYSLSKLLTESSIMNQSKWESFITIARLGNMIGSPGSIYSGKSNLFAFEVIRDLINYKKITIRSNPSKQIGFVPISYLFSSPIFTRSGFYKIYNLKKNSIYAITKIIQKSYENLSGNKSEILFNKKVNHIKDELVSNDLKKEIELMVLYFLKETS